MIVPLSLQVALVAMLVLTAGFFEGAETVYTSADRLSLQGRSRHGDQRARLARRLLVRMENLLGVTLVGTNLALVGAATVADSILFACFPLISEGTESLLNTMIMTPIVLIFSEFMPKSLGRVHANQLVLLLARPLRLVQWLLFPVVFAVSRTAVLMANLFGRGEIRNRFFIGRDDLRIAAEMAAEQGVLTKTAGGMLRRVFELESRSVTALMMPLGKVVMLPAEAALEAMEKLALDTGFTRFPVYAGREDNIIGIVDLRDVLYGFYDLRGRRDKNSLRSIGEFVQRDILQVHEDKTVGALLQDLRYRKANMIVILNGAGIVIGIITIRDLMDAVVGHPEIAAMALHLRPATSREGSQKK